MKNSISTQDLYIAYQEATRKDGIIELLKSLRGNTTTLKISELNSCFASKLWVKTPQATGHCKLVHKVTKVAVVYQNHGKEDVAFHIKIQILEQLDRHINTLGNDIFGYKVRNWKTVPNFDQALQKLSKK